MTDEDQSSSGGRPFVPPSGQDMAVTSALVVLVHSLHARGLIDRFQYANQLKELVDIFGSKYKDPGAVQIIESMVKGLTVNAPKGEVHE